jgi:hypothetical protein
MNKKPLIVVIFACFALASAAAGQEGTRARGQGMMGQGMGQRGGRVRENLATLRLLRMTQALDLSEDQTSRIFPFINKIDREKAGLQRRTSADIQELRRLLANGNAADAEILPFVGRIRNAQDEIRRMDAETEAFLEKSLSPVQRGKYILFQIDFYRLLEQAVTGLKPQRGAAAVPIKK